MHTDAYVSMIEIVSLTMLKNQLFENSTKMKLHEQTTSKTELTDTFHQWSISQMINMCKKEMLKHLT